VLIKSDIHSVSLRKGETMDDSIYGEELHRYFILWRKCNSMYETWAKKYDLSCNEVLVLNTIVQTPNCTQKIISEWLSISKQTVNMILKRFENDGIVIMKPYELDKRSKIITLTEKGIITSKKLMSELIEIETKAAKGLGLDRFSAMNNTQEDYIRLFTQYADFEN